MGVKKLLITKNIINFVLFRGMLSSAHVLAMDAKNLLDVMDKIRMRFSQVNDHILRGHFSSYSSMSSDSTGGSSSAASSLEKSASTTSSFGSSSNTSLGGSSSGSGGRHHLLPRNLK